ncbi:MAG: D-alanine--D-alanine ligase [Candidatus Scalinduaceae bacterium]
MLDKKNIAVLMGGISSEREISFQSGKAVANALRKTNNNVIEIVVNDSVVDELDNHEIDVAFIALHGYFGEDGGIQEILESKGIPYTGSGVYASKLAMNKLKSKSIFKKNNILTPDYQSVSTKQTVRVIIKRAEKLGLPVVTKPIDNGSSAGISLIKEYDELKDGINYAGLFGNEILIEKYIEGRELAVGILNDKLLPIIEIKPASKFYDYVAKYKDKRTQYIVLKSDNKSLFHSTYTDAQELAVQAHNSLECRGFSRVDMILGKDGKIYVLEVNTIPGFTERSLLPKAANAVNIGFVELCSIIVDTALKHKHTQSSEQSVQVGDKAAKKTTEKSNQSCYI